MLRRRLASVPVGRVNAYTPYTFHNNTLTMRTAQRALGQTAPKDAPQMSSGTLQATTKAGPLIGSVIFAFGMYMMYRRYCDDKDMKEWRERNGIPECAESIDEVTKGEENKDVRDALAQLTSAYSDAQKEAAAKAAEEGGDDADRETPLSRAKEAAMKASERLVEGEIQAKRDEAHRIAAEKAEAAREQTKRDRSERESAARAAAARDEAKKAEQIKAALRAQAEKKRRQDAAAAAVTEPAASDKKDEEKTKRVVEGSVTSDTAQSAKPANTESASAAPVVTAPKKKTDNEGGAEAKPAVAETTTPTATTSSDVASSASAPTAESKGDGNNADDGGKTAAPASGAAPAPASPTMTGEVSPAPKRVRKRPVVPDDAPVAVTATPPPLPPSDVTAGLIKQSAPEDNAAAEASLATRLESEEAAGGASSSSASATTASLAPVLPPISIGDEGKEADKSSAASPAAASETPSPVATDAVAPTPPVAESSSAPAGSEAVPLDGFEASPGRAMLPDAEQFARTTADDAQSAAAPSNPTTPLEAVVPPADGAGTAAVVDERVQLASMLEQQCHHDIKTCRQFATDLLSKLRPVLAIPDKDEDSNNNTNDGVALPLSATPVVAAEEANAKDSSSAVADSGNVLPSAEFVADSAAVSPSSSSAVELTGGVAASQPEATAASSTTPKNPTAEAETKASA